MMPISFEQANKVFTAPAGMTAEECSDLHTWQGETDVEDQPGLKLPAVISCWKLSYEDLQELQNNGGVIWLSITGQGMPPVSLFTENPFK